MQPFPEEVRANVDLANVELRKSIVDEAIAVQPGAETAGNAWRVKAEFEVFLFSLLGLAKRFFDPARWHDLAEGQLSTLFLNLLLLFGGGQWRGLAGVRMTAHPFVIPTVE